MLGILDAITGTSESGMWIILIGSLVAAACSLVGCFLILRRLSMLGDAISHAVLPGIVIAFLFTGSRNIVPMFVGAGLVGILTAFLTDLLNRHGRLQSDAAIGITFTWLFALGVVLVSKFAGSVDLDLDCVLYGEILYAPFDTVTIGGVELGPRSVWTMGFAGLANVIFVLFCWKQLKVCAFDEALAASLGIRVALWHYLLMGFVSMTTVAAFESVGAILVVAMLVVPPNTAYLLTDRLWLMVLLSVFCGVVSSILGYGIATWLNGSIAGAMAATAGALYVLAALFSPSHGVISRYLSLRRARKHASVTAPDDAAAAFGGRG